MVGRSVRGNLSSVNRSMGVMFSTEMQAIARVRRNQELVASEIEGKTVLLSIERGKYYGFEEVGTRIWQLMEQAVSISEICAVLEQEFEVDPDTCRNDVYAFLDMLRTEDLIAVENESAG